MSAPCKHEILIFGSGGFYVFCQVCQVSWMAVAGPTQAADHSRGEACLDGHDRRVSVDRAAFEKALEETNKKYGAALQRLADVPEPMCKGFVRTPDERDQT